MAKVAKPSLNVMTEVFGFPVSNFSEEAQKFRKNRLCPFNNKVPNCTKDKANDPLGVCSINVAASQTTIICPIRFRENWDITIHAAEFFFGEGVKWTSLMEVSIKDKNKQSAGNIDIVLVAYNDQGKIIDFGAVEVQGVYISGNIREPFKRYMVNPEVEYNKPWTATGPRPDYLSSSRKRLAPQLLFKGGILQAWHKKMVVALHSGFYKTLPYLEEVSPEEAEIAWLLYDLEFDSAQNKYKLQKTQTVYTKFDTALERITKPEIGDVTEFLTILQRKLDEKNLVAPTAPILTEIEEETEETEFFEDD